MSKRILIIPDVHGRTFWKTALDTGKYEKVIFLGDYVDPYVYEGIDNLMAISNFKDILSLKMIYQDKVILLLGNHDLCYLSDQYRGIAENDRYDYENEEELQNLFRGGVDSSNLPMKSTSGADGIFFPMRVSHSLGLSTI